MDYNPAFAKPVDTLLFLTLELKKNGVSKDDALAALQRIGEFVFADQPKQFGSLKELYSYLQVSKLFEATVAEQRELKAAAA
jgi:hypothetical protein